MKFDISFPSTQWDLSTEQGQAELKNYLYYLVDRLTDVVNNLDSLNMSESYSVNAAEIHLEGVTTVNDGFSIDRDGRMTANGANIAGKLEVTSGIGGTSVSTSGIFLSNQSAQRSRAIRSNGQDTLYDQQGNIIRQTAIDYDEDDNTSIVSDSYTAGNIKRAVISAAGNVNLFDADGNFAVGLSAEDTPVLTIGSTTLNEEQLQALLDLI